MQDQPNQDPTPQELDNFDHTRKTIFAETFAFGETLSRSLIAAGYSTKSLNLAYQLLRDPEVQTIIATSREWIKVKLVENTDTVLQQLQRDRDFAYDQDNPSAAISATNSIAKILGLLDPDRAGKVPAKITIEWGEGTDVADMVGKS